MAQVKEICEFPPVLYLLNPKPFTQVKIIPAPPSEVYSINPNIKVEVLKSGFLDKSWDFHGSL